MEEGNSPFHAFVKVETLLVICLCITVLIFQIHIWLIFIERLKRSVRWEKEHKVCSMSWKQELHSCWFSTPPPHIYLFCGVLVLFVSSTLLQNWRVRVGSVLGIRLRFHTFFLFKNWENLVGIKYKLLRKKKMFPKIIFGTKWVLFLWKVKDLL